MSKVTILALLATLTFFGWFARDNDGVARTPSASSTSNAIAVSNPVESLPKRRSKIATEALVLGTTLAAQPQPARLAAAPNSHPQPAQDVRYVSALTLRMRGSPSAKAKMVGSYPRGTAMTIKEQSGGWYHVTAPDGRTGWMAAKYLSQEMAGG